MPISARAAHLPIAEMWTGFRPLSADGLPLLGRGELEGLYFLTGHGPSGIALARFDCAVDGPDPRRTPARAGGSV
ncbi:MAG: FAD-dependent oxidoreductase [Chloroflexi bacterium]|nr:FAD-dependent oxidoreductase [Chloroflexota bacterium]